MMAMTLWMSNDMTEKISYSQDEYHLVKLGAAQPVLLGSEFSEAKESLQEMGRNDIVKQLPN
ncbi:hypothetical protein HA075_22495 [bacterium BFN5]|nr:hypothetical protein HA075_22495 [bacterium BFN5]